MNVKILTPDRKYMVFWGIVEVTAMFPFYYYVYKIHKGWPNMNDEHDNAQTDKEMLRKFNPSTRLEYLRSIPHTITDEQKLELAALEGHGYLKVPEQKLAETETIHAYIRSGMCDLEIVNEIIRVAGYERTEAIATMLYQRTIGVGPEEPVPYMPTDKQPETFEETCLGVEREAHWRQFGH
jgi:hypothetical protein